MNKVINIKFLCLSLLLIGSASLAMDENRAEELCEAARTGNLTQVGALLDAGTSVNARDRHEDTPLIAAIREGHIEVCRLLLKHNAQVNDRRYTKTPLIYAAEWGRKEIAQLLIEHKAQVDTIDFFGWTALRWAAQYGSLDICKLLLDHNADIDTQDDDGHTPLEAATQKGFCQLLIDRKIKSEINKAAITLFGIQKFRRATCMNGIDRKATQLIARHLANSGVTPLIWAAYNGRTETCQLLLNKNEKVDAKDNFGQTALMLAASNGHTNVCKLLVNTDADVEATSKCNDTALMRAAQNGHKEVCHLLINTKIKQIDKAAAIALLGMSRFNRARCMNGMDRNIIRLIARQVVDVDAETKRLFAPIDATKYETLFAQIDEIKDTSMRATLRTYAQEQLKMNPNISQGKSHE